MGITRTAVCGIGAKILSTEKELELQSKIDSFDSKNATEEQWDELEKWEIELDEFQTDELEGYLSGLVENTEFEIDTASVFEDGTTHYIFIKNPFENSFDVTQKVQNLKDFCKEKNLRIENVKLVEDIFVG